MRNTSSMALRIASSPSINIDIGFLSFMDAMNVSNTHLHMPTLCCQCLVTRPFPTTQILRITTTTL
ncbi:hypothetical protein GBA52_015039 [Prunus armeniaca]|nr:hypothetical protein GBA52_015039 [Prunus armeniaca]